MIIMLNNKIWKISGIETKYSDEEIVEMIQDGRIKPDDRIATKDMKKWIKVKDSIYQFYITQEAEHENI